MPNHASEMGHFLSKKFWTKSGRKKVQMMDLTTTLEFANLPSMQSTMVRLPYQGDRIVLDILLPKPRRRGWKPRDSPTFSDHLTAVRWSWHTGSEHVKHWKHSFRPCGWDLYWTIFTLDCRQQSAQTLRQDHKRYRLLNTDMIVLQLRQVVYTIQYRVDKGGKKFTLAGF